MNEIVVYTEIAKGKKTQLVETGLKSDNYYDDNNIVFFTGTQLKALLDGIDNSFHRFIVLTLYETGGRVDECRNIKFSDIDAGTGRCKVLTLKQRKTNKIYRYLKISDKLLSAILNHRIANQLSESDFIFAKVSGNPAIARKSIAYILKYNTLRILGKDELHKAHPHALRHTRAIHLLDAGMNIMLLKNFLGHSNISNTLIYLKYSNKDMAAAIDNANNAYSF
jgi:integrase